MKRFATVCSGIGAPELAAQALDWECVFSSDIEAFPNAVREVRFPGVPNLGDMTKFEEWPDACHCSGDQIYEKGKCQKCGGYGIDVLIGGTPCQSFSVAGLRAGLDDARGQLMLTFVDIAARYRPGRFLWENVPGVLSSNGGKDFAAFLGAVTGTEVCVPAEGWANAGWLAGIPAAYGIAWRVLDAQYFGVAQRRRRVFVVGHIGGLWQRAAAVLFERESLRGDPAPRRETGKGFTHSIAPSIGASGLGFERGGETRGQDPVVAVQVQESGKRKAESGNEVISFNHQAGGSKAMISARETHTDALTKNQTVAVVQPVDIDGSEVGFALRANASHSGDKGDGGVNTNMVVTHALRGEGFDASEDGTGRGTPIVAEGFRMTAFGEYSDDGTASAMKRRDFKDATDLVVQPAAQAIPINMQAAIKNGKKSPNMLGVGNPGEPSPTLGASDRHAVGAFARGAANMAVRRLTPRECERLQGFPDDFTLINIRNKPAADGPRYKALGNSMAVLNIRWILSRMDFVDELISKAESGNTESGNE